MNKAIYIPPENPKHKLMAKYLRDRPKSPIHILPDDPRYKQAVELLQEIEKQEKPKPRSLHPLDLFEYLMGRLVAKLIKVRQPKG